MSRSGKSSSEEGVTPPSQSPYRELRTDRLRLRPPGVGDAQEIFDSFASDPGVTRYLTWTPHQTLADAEAALTKRLERLHTESEYSWILQPSSDRGVVGLISAWVHGDAAELGFVLARAFWNQGLATEAVCGVCQWAFEARGVTRVWATCDVENHASVRVLEKSGFANRGEYTGQIVRPNLSDRPRPSLLYRIDASRRSLDGRC